MSNTLTYVTPTLLAQGLLALRQNAIMTRLVNRDYQGMASMRGNVINVPKPSSITARSVTPSVTINSNVESSPTSVAITLDRWYEAPFHLSDADALTAMNGFIPMQASEAIKALANDIDKFIIGKHTGIYSASGTAGTTPFASAITVAVSARTLLNKQLCPMDDRRVVLSPEAEGNALALSNIIQFDQRGDQGGIINGSIGRKLGMDWYMDQNVLLWTNGTAWITGWSLDTSAAVGATSITVTNATATSGTVIVGDIFNIGSQQYVVTSAFTHATADTIYFYPALTTAAATGAAITVVDATDCVPNLVFHRDAFVWVSRPLADTDGLGNAIMSATDDVSGVALRLELSRQYKQTTFSYDYLGGAALVVREYATKILG